MVKSSIALSALDQLVNDLQREIRDALGNDNFMDPEELDVLTTDVLRDMFDSVGEDFIQDAVGPMKVLNVEDDYIDHEDEEDEDIGPILDRMFPLSLDD